MISTPGMTSRGKRIAALCALVVVALLPKHVECGYPGGECSHLGMFKQVCTYWEVEPLGVFLVEKLVDRNVGFAYKRGEDCR
jgi:hypothetical protein